MTLMNANEELENHAEDEELFSSLRSPRLRVRN
jgi:hypothetical protein